MGADLRRASPHRRHSVERAEPGTEFVVTLDRDACQNLRTTFLTIIKRTGLSPWPKLPRKAGRPGQH